jgi:hypothetical protein
METGNLKVDVENSLEEFFKGFSNFLSAICDGAVGHFAEREEANSFIEFYRIGFEHASTSVGNELLKHFDTQDDNEKKNILNKMTAYGAMPLIAQANKIVSPEKIGFNFGGILENLPKILEKLKNLIRDIFPKMPTWLNILLDVIDNILQMLTGHESAEARNDAFEIRTQDFKARQIRAESIFIQQMYS